MDWPGSVYRITAADGEPGFGTGFVVRHDGDLVLLVTCWHVARDIGREHLQIDGLPCALLSTDGDDELDLALLAVRGLPAARPLPLAAAGATGRRFATFGYEPTGRPLAGELGARTWRDHASHAKLPAWDFYLDDRRALERIREGYSGSPVVDAATGAVVAVITHGRDDTGFALDIANLPRVHPPAQAWLDPRPPVASPDDDHDYQTRLESALAKLLDHQSQLVGVAELLAARTDRVLIGVVECSAEDWPSYLAHHLQCAQATDPADAILSEAIELNLRRRSDARAIWSALVETANGVSAPSDDARRTAVRALLAGPGLRVLYAHVDVRLHGRHLAALIDGAAADLRALGELGTETRVLLLIGAGRDPERPPFWWRWRHRHAVRRLDCCHGLTAMAPLTGEDVEGWYQDFPALLRHCLDRDRIKTELLDLFAAQGAVRYQRVRKLLLGDGVADPGALRRARLRPCDRSAR
jgi:hypothetical protein